MNYSEIDICNLSLSMLGADSIRAFDENNKRARLCKNLYRFSRDHILSQHTWPFAKGYEELKEVLLENTNIPLSDHTYQLPNDCLAAEDIEPKGSDTKWTVKNRVLYTPIKPVYLYYTKQITDPTLFALPFINILSAYLAYRLAPAISKNPKMVPIMRENYGLAVQESMGVEANKENDYKGYDEQYENDTFFSSGNDRFVEDLRASRFRNW